MRVHVIENSTVTLNILIICLSKLTHTVRQEVIFTNDYRTDAKYKADVEVQQRNILVLFFGHNDNMLNIYR